MWENICGFSRQIFEAANWLIAAGSTEVGKLVMASAARSNLKQVTLELGGKSPVIICENADVDKAVELSHSALFFNQGQCCAAGSRTFVHESHYEEFVEKSKARALQRVVGDPFKAGVHHGPQVDKDQFEKILNFINQGEQQGATLLTGKLSCLACIMMIIRGLIFNIFNVGEFVPPLHSMWLPL